MSDAASITAVQIGVCAMVSDYTFDFSAALVDCCDLINSIWGS
jgi:hypothetical protein